MLVIRAAQLSALARAQPFVEKLAAHLRERWPERCDPLGPEGLRDLVADLTARAHGYGIRSERGIARFAALCFSLGDDFDTRHPWAGPLLSDDARPEHEKLEALTELAFQALATE